MTETPSEPKKRFWLTLLRPKVAIPLGLLVLLLLSPVLYRGWNLGHVPDLGDPFPAELLEKPTLPTEDNAWVNYQRAEELMSAPRDEAVVPPVFRQLDLIPASMALNCISIWREPLDQQLLEDYIPLPPTSKELAEYLKWHEEALEEWKTGTTKVRYFELSPRIERKESNTLLDFLNNDYRDLQLHEMALARAGQLASRGKPLDALDWILAVFRFSRHLTQSGGTQNWERAVGITYEVFRALDELLEDQAFTHDELVTFLHQLETCHELTGDFKQALADDYLVLKQEILNAYAMNTQHSEELETGSSLDGKNHFELYIEGEPQLSLRLLQHHYEYIKANLTKPVDDRVVPRLFDDFDMDGRSDRFSTLHGTKLTSNSLLMSSEQMSANYRKAKYFPEAIARQFPDCLSDTHLGNYCREEDRVLFESLRILISAHAFNRLYPDNINWPNDLFISLNEQDREQLVPLPLVTMEELINAYFSEAPRDPYDPASELLLAVCQTGESFILTSRSENYRDIVNGASSEIILNRFYPLFSRIPMIEPGFVELPFQLPTAETRKSRGDYYQHKSGLQWVPEKVYVKAREFLRVLH